MDDDDGSLQTKAEKAESEQRWVQDHFAVSNATGLARARHVEMCATHVLISSCQLPPFLPTLARPLSSDDRTQLSWPFFNCFSACVHARICAVPQKPRWQVLDHSRRPLMPLPYAYDPPRASVAHLSSVQD